VGAYVLVRVEDFSEALQAQLVVPRLSKTDMLRMQVNEANVVIADDVAAPLLDGNVMVAPVPRSSYCARCPASSDRW
jgi:hypothetical protein